MPREPKALAAYKPGSIGSASRSLRAKSAARATIAVLSGTGPINGNRSGAVKRNPLAADRAWGRYSSTAAPVARANGAFLGIEVPAGAREVRLHLDSRGDARGLQASLFGAGALVLLALSGLLKRRAPAGADASEATA